MKATTRPLASKTMIRALLAGMLMVAFGPAVAQSQDIEVCKHAGENPEAGTAACTRLLEREIRDTARRQAIALSNRAWAWKTEGQLGRAVSDLTDAIGADPSFVNGYLIRGDIYREREQWDKAIADYDQVIRVLPEQAATYVTRGTCWIGKQDYDRALADYEQVTKLDPDNAKGTAALAWGMKATLHSVKGDGDQAITDLDHAIRLDPQRAVLRLGRGNLWIAKGNPERAIADYDGALKLDPKLAAAYKMRGNIYQNQGNYLRAIQDYDRVINLNSDDLDVYGARAMAHFYLGDFNKAADDFGRLAQGQNTYPMLWLYVARARSGTENARGELAANAEHRSQRDWPFPIVELFLDQRSPNAAEAAAVSPDQQCEAQFYIGEWYLLRQARNEAAAALRSAADKCRKEVVESEAATQELNRLKP